MRPSRPRATVTARKSHAPAIHARNNFCCTHGVRERAICGGGRSAGTAWDLIGRCLGAALVLIGYCLIAARVLLGRCLSAG
eukprot:2376913-Lingulodinium_polyedra.AAC.1